MGCGTGQLTIPLAQHVAAAIGMDPEPEDRTPSVFAAAVREAQEVAWMTASSASIDSAAEAALLT